MEPTAVNLQTLDLPSSTLEERTAHANLLLELEAKKIAATLDVPTLANQVSELLRKIGEPIRLFGENNANVRDRLRLSLAKLQIKNEGKSFDTGDLDLSKLKKPGKEEEEDVQTDTKYTQAENSLIEAREFIAAYSLEKSRQRLSIERKRRWGANSRVMKRRVIPSITGDKNDDYQYMEHEVLQQLDDLDTCCLQQYKKLRNMALEGSQYGDGRPLSAIATLRQNPNEVDNIKNNNIIVTGGWTGSIKLWDGSTSALDLISTRNMAHEDRIMGVAINSVKGGNTFVASASIDLLAKIWQIQYQNGEKCILKEAAVLKGHEARLCKVAFHPSGRYVGTTSFDHSWRFWDIEAGGKELLLQDGHWKEVYGIGFHPDGSLCSTGDFGSVVQLWDLRTGKSVSHFLGHAKRVLCTEFSPNGFQMCTAGDDGTIKVWDLRQRKQYASIPAHSNLITQIKFANNISPQNGEYLSSSSFDGTGKVWSTRDWKLVSTFRGHEGKVMGIDILPDDHGMVTCGYDKTLKIWS